MRALLSALCLTLLVAPAAARDGPRQTQSATQRVVAPDAFDAAFEKGDYEGAFVILGPAIIACVKAQRVQDECLDLLLIGTATASRAKALDVALTLAEQAANVAEAALPETDRDRLTAARNLASVLDKSGKGAEALVWHRKALALAERQLPPEAAEIGSALAALVAGLADSHDLAEREGLERRLLAWREKADRQNVPTSHADLALILKKQGKYDAAEAEYAIAYAMFAKAFGPNHEYTRSVMLGRIDNLETAGRMAEALPMLAALAVANPDDRALLARLGRMQRAHGDNIAAEATFRRALALVRADPKADPVQLADHLVMLGTAVENRDRPAEAEALYREALALIEPRLAGDAPLLLTTLGNLAGAVMDQGRLAEAELLYRRVLAAREVPLERATTLSNLSVVLAQMGRYDEAATVQGEAIALRQANLPADSLDIAGSQAVLAAIEEQRKGHAAAIALRRSAYAIYLKKLGREHISTAAAAQNLALAMAYTRTDIAEIDRLLLEARRVMRRLDPTAYQRIVNASYVATSWLAERKRLAEARALLRESTDGVQARVAGFRDFGPAAQSEMRVYRPIFIRQVVTAWALTPPASR
jgi:tetratricopeptide (TPR) repeat protein